MLTAGTSVDVGISLYDTAYQSCACMPKPHSEDYLLDDSSLVQRHLQAFAQMGVQGSLGVDGAG